MITTSAPNAPERQQIDAMERELALLSTQLEVATHRQLTLLRELEPTGIWYEQHASSYAHWLSWKIGLAPGAAREKIRVARALGRLPAIDGAFAAGRLSYSKVRAVTRVATPENDALLAAWGQQTTAAHLEKICRTIRRADHDAELASDVEQRWVRRRAGDYGMVRIEAQIHPDEAAIVWQAIERVRLEAGIPHPDALVRLASGESTETERASPELVVHVREELLEDGSGALAATLEDGRRVPAETLRRVACDCATQAVSTRADGTPLDVGRRRRLVTPALRRALLARDGGCRFPGCAHHAWLDAHHVDHWLHGGETKLSNLVMLCTFHHRLVHEGGFTIDRRGGLLAFRDPRGTEVRALPSPIDLVDALQLRVSAEARAQLDTLVPDWDGRPPDLEACVMAVQSRSHGTAQDRARERADALDHPS